MTVILKLAHHIDLYERFVQLFADMSFSSLIDEKIQQAIVDLDGLVLSKSIVKKFCFRYLQPSDFARKEDFKEAEFLFKTLCVTVVTAEEKTTSLYIRNTDELLRDYPDFRSASSTEIADLLVFRNMVIATLLVVEARLNKQLIIDICARFEGNFVKYITGTGQSSAVKRRVAIYEREGGVVPEKRPYRAKPVTPEPSPSSAKRKVSSSAPVPPAKLQKDYKKRRYNEPPLVVVQTPIVTPTSSSAPCGTPDLPATLAPLASDDDMLTLLSELPFDGESFFMELDFIPDASKVVSIVCVASSAPLDASAFLKDSLEAALSKGFYDSSYTDSCVTVSCDDKLPAPAPASAPVDDECVTDVEDMLECASFDEVSLLNDLGFSFTSEFSISGIF